MICLSSEVTKMEERFTRLYSQDGMLYTEGSPVIVSAGAVLSDSLTKSFLVQLKFKNISDRTISSLSVSIQPLSASGEEKGKVVEYKYSGLDAHRDDCFGTKTAVVIPDTEIRSYKLRISAVLFDDGSRWQSKEEYFTPLSAPKLLEDAFEDEELSHQFKISYGGDCDYMPSEEKDLWFCTCGAINHAEELKCHKCRRVHSALKNINISALRSENSRRVSSEKKFEEEEDLENAEKRTKLIKLLAVLVPALIIIIALLATLPGYFKMKNGYENAVALLDSGKLDEAQTAFEALGDYENSRELAEQEIPYRRAMYIMSCAESGDTDGLVMLGMKRSELGEGETVSTALYRKAIEMFTALGSYKDSATQVTNAENSIADYYDSLLHNSYDEATALLNAKSFCKARDAFAALGDYRDCASMADECIYQKAEQLMALTEKYSMEGIFCTLSTVTGEKSVFYIPQSIYIKLGSGISTDIRDICSSDGVEIKYEEVPDSGYLPYCDAVSELYASLGNYKDSTEKSGAAADAGDYTKPFYAFIQQGKLAEALTWLNEFQGDFPESDRWASFISRFLPYCGTWSFDSGDPTLIPRTLGIDVQCSSITTLVFLSDDGSARLQIYIEGSAEYIIEMQLSINENGSISFIVSPDDMTFFHLVLNNAGKLVYSKHSRSIPTDTQSAVYA